MRRRIALIAAVACLAPVVVADADTQPDDLIPVLHAAVPTGSWHTEPAGTEPVSLKTVDGDISDWIGTPTRFAGTSVLSRGEYIYSDHVLDAYGADDGGDADRIATFGPVNDRIGQAYRIEPLMQADVPGEVGAPNPYPVDEEYGDAGYQAKADLVELRLAADDEYLYVLARTSAMSNPTDTAVLLLANTQTGTRSTLDPFGAGIKAGVSEVAILLAHGAGRAVEIDSGASTSIEAVANPSGYTNAIEARIPLALVTITGGPNVEFRAGAGLYSASTGGFADLPGSSNLANIAFRTREPVRIASDQQQAIALFNGSIDDFRMNVALEVLQDGWTERFVPERGYFERVFTSSTQISSEGGSEGIFQPYGVYLPAGYATRTAPVPATFWFHWRGGKAHSAGTMIPRLFRDVGEGLGGIVISPRGRGTSSWYLGRGQVDFLEVWDDAMATFDVDRDRVYSIGHSMGGWASYLFPILYPDRFAATMPVSPPVTQGAWTGLDFPNCDEYNYEEYTFCYVGANDSTPRIQHTRPLLENLRNVPIAIYAGGADELVPISGEIRQAERLLQLGYQHRLYVFPTYEHYTPPVVDEWMEGARYFAQHKRDPNPRQVSYIRDMRFERSVEIGPSQTQNPYPGLNFDFDRAYWMSGLTPADPVNGRATFEGTAGGIAGPEMITVPEAGGPAAPGQAGPFAMTGLRSIPDPTGRTTGWWNAFEVTMTGATAVTLDIRRMGLPIRVDDLPIEDADGFLGLVDVDRPITLTLLGDWTTSPSVRTDTGALPTSFVPGQLTIHVPAGSSTLTIELT